MAEPEKQRTQAGEDTAHLPAFVLGLATFFGGVAAMALYANAYGEPGAVLSSLPFVAAGAAVWLCERRWIVERIARAAYSIRHRIPLIDPLPAGAPRGCVEFRRRGDWIAAAFEIRTKAEGSPEIGTRPIGFVGPKGVRLAVPPGRHRYRLTGGTASEDLDIQVEENRLVPVGVSTHEVRKEQEVDGTRHYFTLDLAVEEPRQAEPAVLSLAPMRRVASRVATGLLVVLLLVPGGVWLWGATAGAPGWVKPLPAGPEGLEHGAVVAWVDEEGGIRFDGETMREREEITDFLVRNARRYEPYIVLIEGSDDARFHAMNRVMDAAATLGAERFAFRERDLEKGRFIRYGLPPGIDERSVTVTIADENVYMVSGMNHFIMDAAELEPALSGRGGISALLIQCGPHSRRRALLDLLDACDAAAVDSLHIVRM